MADITLSAQHRTASGKGAARQTRMQGLVPGIFYHHSAPSIPIAIDRIALNRLMKERHAIVTVQIGEEEPRECVLREIQRDPVTSDIIHIDFMGVLAGQKLVVAVPVRLIGLPEGVKTGGGILQSGLKHLSIECLPKDIPDFLEVDVSALKIGQSIHVSNVSFPNIKLMDDPHDVVATVQPPTILKETKPEEAVVAEGEAAAAAPAEGEAAAADKEGEKGAAKPGEKAAKGEKAGKGDKPSKGEKK